METPSQDNAYSEICCRSQSTSSSRLGHRDWTQSDSRRQNCERCRLNSSSSREAHCDSYYRQYTPAPLPYQDFGSNVNEPIMERTPSGRSIISSSPLEPLPSVQDLPIHKQRDLAAATRVDNSFRRRPQNSKHERILRKLIRRDEPLDSGFMLDDPALESILTAADTLFFDGMLAGRVQWEWSSNPQYRTELIGTTALRRCVGREGFETLIVLSEPLLRNERYDRRLLLSAFLHELIHCYLFISCGFDARMEGGHTDGFYRIAEIIDSWVGPRYLSIGKLREDPERFHRQLQHNYMQADYSNYMRRDTLENDDNEDINRPLYILSLSSHSNINHDKYIMVPWNGFRYRKRKKKHFIFVKMT
ncbi:hypothetical protein GcM1_235104 [Golovinomyces cichoracearum]|uniref:SprT-like domain-containing protein n=1 Tax=Golovinomyces cichoracearum TaxID=62708 RepID=A0A420IL28_9PEZI|nr:hypothetical protein GcM1_235104 [Golovinomyces cichoracearum]